MESKEKVGFEELCSLIDHKKEVWIRLYDGLRICLVGYVKEKQEFIGKFIPCSNNSRKYSILYKDVRDVLGDKNGCGTRTE